MSLVKIESVSVHLFEIPNDNYEKICISVTGTVPSSGWSHPRISPRVYIANPNDGFWDMDLLITPPTGLALQVVSPFFSQETFNKPEGFKGVRIHPPFEGDVVSQEVSEEDIPVGFIEKKLSQSFILKGVICQEIFQYDDSFQPTGTIHWKNDGPFGLPNPHVEMKKLHHSIIITVEGVDDDSFHNCLNRAFNSALIASIAAAFLSGGMAAASSFLSVGLQSLKDCLANDAIDININDDSHWVYWDL
ncbi:hypothetical protein [Klebsiella sp. JB_Kp036]|uniref:hypothetical protein n=1 Tax=Klebsiella sp. JB_Kp036 TaxID=3153388 RepID=UPI0032B439AF